MKRAMNGFVGPKDIFRNPESMFRQFEKTSGDSPFDLELSHSGDDFAVMGMHFKLGLYEHQSAGALQGLIDLVWKDASLLDESSIQKIVIRAYEPAFGIIGDPAKRDPHTRQSADHSMVYIVATMLRKAIEHREKIAGAKSTDDVWKALMLSPYDYDQAAIFNTSTRNLMDRISFEHGGPDYDARYPDGIPTSLVITDAAGKEHDSGLVMYPGGHARNTTANLGDILAHKFGLLGELADESGEFVRRLEGIASTSGEGMRSLYNFSITARPGYE
jgi:2-methylcitrate dehydratase